MRYLLCIVCPPVAVLLCAKPITALLNVLLTLACGIPGIIHAFAVVGSHKADVRNNKLVRAVRGR